MRLLLLAQGDVCDVVHDRPGDVEVPSELRAVLLERPPHVTAAVARVLVLPLTSPVPGYVHRGRGGRRRRATVPHDHHADKQETEYSPHGASPFLNCFLPTSPSSRDFRYGAIPPLMAASTERTVPSVNSFTLPDTLTAVLLANPGACVTGCFWVRSHRPCRRETAPPSRLPSPIPADLCTVLRITSDATRVARCA